MAELWARFERWLEETPEGDLFFRWLNVGVGLTALASPAIIHWLKWLHGW